MASATVPATHVSSGPAGQNIVSRIVLYAVLIIFALFFLLPLAWMFVTAIKPFQETFLPNWIPEAPTWQNFRDIFADPTVPVVRWFLNSALIATIFTLIVLFIDALAGYAYARMEFSGKNILFGLLLATLVMPGIMFLVPNYVTVARLGLLNNYAGVMLPGLAGVFGVFFLRQFFQGIPKELEEAAIVDGAGTWTTFFRISLPLAKGALVTLGVITFMGSWNDFLWPLLIMNRRELQTLPVGLATLQGQFTFNYGILMAGATIAAVPVLIIYMFLQRYIVQSVAMTGLKG